MAAVVKIQTVNLSNVMQTRFGKTCRLHKNGFEKTHAKKEGYGKTLLTPKNIHPIAKLATWEIISKNQRCLSFQLKATISIERLQK